MSKQQWRRTWFQVHQWIGLLLAVLIVPISLTGAVLVWHEELEPLVSPERFAVSGEATLAPGAYVAAARAVLKPGDRMAQLSMPEEGGPVMVSAASADAPARPGPPQRTNVYLDPPTARVLEVSAGNAGLMRTLHVLHGTLMVPGVGRSIVGWIGVAMMLSAFTGLWLWWPSVGSWTRGLRWRRGRDVNTNLHHLGGFWIALPLFVLSLTGAWISFPAFFGALSGQNGGGPARAMGARARPLLATTLTPDDAVTATGYRAFRTLSWPTEQKPVWTVRTEVEQLTVDDRTARLAHVDAPQGGVARLMRRVHDGTNMGIVWRVIITLGGLIPVALAVTGMVMWWRARGWRAETAGTRRARVSVAAE